MSVLIPILITLHVITCLLLIFLVLMQRPRSEGLGAAFGGGMTENFFGAQTTNILGKVTVWLGSLFFIISLVLAMLFAKRGAGETTVQKELLAQPVPAAATPAVPEASPAATSAPAPVTTPEPVPAITPEATPAAPATTDEPSSAAPVAEETSEAAPATEAP